MVFNPSLNPTNDPNYLGYSKEPDKLKGDTSMASLVEGVGNVLGKGAAALDAGIQDMSKQELYQKINNLVEKHVDGITPEDAPAIAGKGSRGAKFAVAGLQGTEEDLAATDQANIPDGLKRKLDGLQRWKAAYDSGSRSQTMFDLEFAKTVAEVKSKYAGYETIIDAQAETLLGNMSGNRVRKDLLNDFNSMASSQNAQLKADMAYFDKHRDEILRAGMGMGIAPQDITFQNWQPNKQKWEGPLNVILAKDAEQKAKKAEYEFAAAGSTHKIALGKVLYGTSVDQIASDVITQTFAAAKVDLGAALNNARLGKLDAAAVTQMDGILANIESQIRQASAQKAREFPDLPPEFIAARDQQALSKVAAMQRQLRGESKDVGAIGMTALELKMQNDSKIKDLIQKYPSFGDYKAINEIFGPNTTGLIMQTNKDFMGDVANATNTYMIKNIGQPSPNPPPKVTSAIDAQKPNEYSKVPSKVRDATIKNVLAVTMDENPAVAARGVDSLYNDPEFVRSFAGLAASNPNKARLLLQDLASPEQTKRMAKLAETQPQVAQQYNQFVERTWAALFKQDVDTLSSAMSSGKYIFEFDPKNLQAIVKFAPGEKGLASPGQAGYRDPQVYANGLNQGLVMLKAQLETVYKDQAPARVAALLDQMGMQYGPTPSVVIPKMIEMIKAAYPAASMLLPGYNAAKVLSGTETPAPDLPPIKRGNKNLTDNPILNIDTQTIPAGMSARDFLQLLQNPPGRRP